MTWIIVIVGIVATCIGWGLTIVSQNKAMVVERNGKFHRVLLTGLHFLLLPGLIDRITVSKNKQKKEIPVQQMFAIPVATNSEGKPKPFDFADGVTAPADVKVWVQIGDPDKKDDEEDLRRAVYRFVYGADDSKDFVASSIDDLTRPIIQHNTSDQALQEANVAGHASVLAELDTRRNLFQTQVGLWLRKENWLTLGDIDLPEVVINSREKILVAEKEAEARKTEAKGIRKAAEFIAKGVTDDGKTGTATGEEAVSVREALLVQQRLKALDTLKGANITLVEPSIGAGVAAMLDIAGQSKKSGKSGKTRSSP